MGIQLQELKEWVEIPNQIELHFSGQGISLLRNLGWASLSVLPFVSRRRHTLLSIFSSQPTNFSAVSNFQRVEILNDTFRLSAG